MAITAAMVKELRELSGAGMMDCKKALNETNGDMEAAMEFLRKNGQAKAEKKAGRIAAEGLCRIAVKGDTSAAVVEVNSETDFVAKNESFQEFVAAVAEQAVNTDAADIDAFMAEAWNADPAKTVKEALVEKIATDVYKRQAHFPVRNRIISGLSDVVLVVEARMKSGTLITVDMALEQGKEVFVVPGRITDALSSGCNELIRQGACMACSPDVLLEELAKNRKKFRKNAAASDGSAEEEPAEDGVKSFLDFTPRAADNIYEEMKKKGISMSLPQLLQNLLELQMEGAVKQEGGYFFLSGEKL